MPTHHLFIGPYTREGSQGIYSLQLDAATGQLSEPVLAAATPNPSYLTLSPDQRMLYAVSESDAMAAAFAVGDDRVHLAPLAATQAAGGRAPCHLAVDRTGRVLLVANYHTGVAATLPINPDGTLRPPATVIRHTGSSVHPERQTTSHAHCVTLAPDNRFVFVCDLGLDKIFVYQLDAGSAQLTPATPAFITTPPGSGPRHLTFAPDGRHAFLVTELGGTLIAYRYDAAHGTLTPTDEKSTLAPGYRGENTSAAVRVHPLGRFVYASNRGPDNIAVFAFDEASERLAFVELVPSGGQAPRDFALSSDGQWLVAAHQFSHTITAFRVDRQTGRLTPTPHRAHISTPVCVLFLD